MARKDVEVFKLCYKEDCDKLFKNENSQKFVTAMSSAKVHSNSQRLRPICRICGEVFRSMRELKRHFSCHTGEKPFKCSECSKQFPRAYLLRQHENKHTGVKAFQCVICSKRFAWKLTLKRHMCLHIGEKPCKSKVRDQSYQCQKSSVVSAAGSCSDAQAFGRVERGRRFAKSDDLSARSTSRVDDTEVTCSICCQRSQHSEKFKVRSTGKMQKEFRRLNSARSSQMNFNGNSKSILLESDDEEEIVNDDSSADELYI